MKLKYFLLSLLLLPFLCVADNQKVVTFGGGGRLGDNILDYTHAKWISYKWGIPLLFQPFEYSDQFVFHEVEEHLTPKKRELLCQKTLDSFAELDAPVSSPTLFFVEHACDSYYEYASLGSRGLYIPVDWNDATFRDMMRALITPKQPLNLTSPPRDIISVAVHFRTGGGFIYDTECMKQALPLRFPEPEYYVQQLNRLYYMTGFEPMYVYIFTDYQHPEEIKNMLKHFLPYDNIEFACRESGNRHDANVLEDMFSMMEFDCLIRPMSHYSMTASHLGNFKIEFYPTHSYWHQSKLVMDQIKIIEKATWDPLNKCWVDL